MQTAEQIRTTYFSGLGLESFGLTPQTPSQAWHSLSPRQRAFCTHYNLYHNAAAAARKAGYSAKGAKTQGHRLLKRPEIQRAIEFGGIDAARAIAASAIPDIVERTINESRNLGLRTVDRARNIRLLSEITGLQQRRRRGRGE